MLCFDHVTLMNVTKMAEHPAKSDIQAVFKRLRSIPTNKQCFDCGSSNPTWASITYGVFLCIDCSAVHRSLGVHVTFIRSTQLDTNWSWLQLRAMQVGGNANAIGFFRQHGCTTKDAQQKYHSRAATLYKDKLHALATHALRLHGTKLHIDSHNDPSSPEFKEVDFFAEHSENAPEPEVEAYPMMEGQKLASVPVPIENGNGSLAKKEVSLESGEGPSVEHALSMSPTEAMAQAEPRKSLIGVKKQPARKGKGGLGAQKVKTNFTEIENRAQQIDKDRELMAVNQAAEEAKTKEEQEKQMASMRLAYQDMSIERKKQEERLKQTDPKKAEQMERLGMGFGGSRGISHSALSDMKTIEQEGGRKSKLDLDHYERRNNKSSFFEDELDMYSGGSGYSSGPPKYDSPFGSSNRKNDDFGWGNSNKDSGWGMDRFDSKQETFSESITVKEDNSILMEDTQSDDGPTRTRKTTSEPVSTSDDAQKKFGSAKSISSDQYFGRRDMDFETRQNLSKFEGSSSISSSDLFGDDRQKSRQSYGSNAPDLQDIKEGVRQGVTKVAGRISNIANGVMSSLQDYTDA